METTESEKKVSSKQAQKTYSQRIKRRHVTAFHESGQRLSHYCRAHRLPTSTLHAWIKKYEKPAELKGVDFVRVTPPRLNARNVEVASTPQESAAPVRPPADLSTPLTVRLHSPSGAVVEISDITSVALCRSLIREGLSCSSS